MSLFKARDWWSTKCGNEEEFDKGCLCVANIDNEPQGSDKIIVASHGGGLWIFHPHSNTPEDGSSPAAGSQAEDLLLESRMKYPILQIAAGRFVSSSDQLHLAILHPRKLSVYTVCVTSGVVKHGTHYHLSLTYEHNLQRSAFSFTYGTFGEVKGKDFVCVQSLDGTLTFFEQESFAFSRFLPGFLTPGPLLYVPKTDSIVTVSSSWTVESYKFQVLAVAKDSETKEESQNLVKGKRVMADWTFSLGEAAVDVCVAEYNNAPPTIFVLGERNLFALRESGLLWYVKKLDFNASCFHVYPSNVEGSIMMLLATYSHTLLVYQNLVLRWASQLPYPPVCVSRATIGDLKGLLVVLSDDGSLSCCYLGTDPSLFVAQVAESREINFEESEKEMAELRKIILSAATTGAIVPKSADDDLSISLVVSQQLDNLKADTEELPDVLPSVMVVIQLKAATPVSDVQVMVHVEEPLEATPAVTVVSRVSDAAQAGVVIQMRDPYLPSSLVLHVLAIYTNNNGVTRVTENSAHLPLRLVVRPCLPSKTAEHKVTIDVNRQALGIAELFPDLVGSTYSSASNAMGFEHYGGAQVTILAAKSSQKYRIQSDVFAAMWLLLSELILRLQRHYRRSAATGSTDFTCSYSLQVPLQEYFADIDRHFECRQKLRQCQEVLGQRSTQFRAIQKQILIKLKDRNPTPLNNMDALLDATQMQILQVTDKIQEHRKELDAASCSLSCSTHMVTTLVRLSSGMKEEEFKILQGALSPHVGKDPEEGWEERTEVGVSYLLQHCFPGGGLDGLPTVNSLSPPKDLNRLKKYLAILTDRLAAKGEHLALPTWKQEDELHRQNEVEEDSAVPIGSQLAGRKSAGSDGRRTAATRPTQQTAKSNDGSHPRVSRMGSADSGSYGSIEDNDEELVSEF